MSPRRDDNGRPYLPLVYYFPFGKDVSLDEDSALVRPFRRILNEGKPIGKITYVFYQDNNGYYVLGSFVYTRKRILFFPGVMDRRVTISPEGQEILRKQIIHTIDHFALEGDYRSYHITLIEKESNNIKYRKLPTRRVNESMFLWFVMSVKDASMLEVAPMTQEFHLKWDNYSELNRRYSIIHTSRDDSIFNTVLFHDNPPKPFFLNFEVFVNVNSSRECEPPVEVYQTGLVHIVQRTDPRMIIPTRSHYILLQGFDGCIWIRVSKIRGNHDEHSAVYM